MYLSFRNIFISSLKILYNIFWSYDSQLYLLAFILNPLSSICISYIFLSVWLTYQRLHSFFKIIYFNCNIITLSSFFPLLLLLFPIFSSFKAPILKLIPSRINALYLCECMYVSFSVYACVCLCMHMNTNCWVVFLFVYIWFEGWPLCIG